MQRSPFPRRLVDLSLYDRSVAFLLLCFLFSCYLLTYTGVIQSSDGLSMFATTESIVRRGELDTNQLLWMGLQQGSYGPDGDLYSRKGAGMALLALPLVWLAQQWAALGLVQAALLLNPFLTAWTGALLYRTVIRLGWSRFVAIVTALAYGLATLAWPYTQTLFSDPVAAWGLFGTLYGILAFQQSGRKRYLFLGGLTWSAAYLARAINLVTLPVYILALAAVLAQVRPLPGGWKRSIQPLAANLRSLLLDYFRQWFFFGFPILLAGLFSLWWNWQRFGSPWATGYVESESFSANWLFGLFGLLVGPARGLIWYSPVILLALVGLQWFWRNVRWLLGVVAGIVLLYILLYGKWYMWHGGYSWGPRFLVPVLPFLMLLSAPAWRHIFEAGSGGTAGRIGATLLLILSLSVQWIGLLIPFSLVQEWLAQTVTPLFADETFTQLRYSPLVLQWRFLRTENLHFAWWRSNLAGVDWLALGLILGTVVSGGWLLARQIRIPAGEKEAMPNWIYGAALVLVTAVLLVRYQPSLSGAGNLEAARQIESYEKAGDAILHLRPSESQQFANSYHGRLPVYGLFPAHPLDSAGRATLQSLAQSYRRLWLLPDPSPPDRSGWEQTLRASAFLLYDKAVAYDNRRVVLYALPNAEPLTETGMGVRFGSPEWVRLNSYGYNEVTEAGGELFISLEWESLRPVAENYQIFVHLLDAAGNRVAQRDGQPVLWLRPTSTWQPGERILDRYGMLLSPDLAPGQYQISVGIYDPQSGQRQPVSAGPDAAVELGALQIRPAQ